jgi:hypothetical protein
MADQVSGSVLRADVRVTYPGGIVSGKQLVQPNAGKIAGVKRHGGARGP